jgi:kynureninase
VIRLAPVALYTSYTEVWRTVEIIRSLVVSGEYLRFEGVREAVS